MNTSFVIDKMSMIFDDIWKICIMHAEECNFYVSLEPVSSKD